MNAELVQIPGVTHVTTIDAVGGYYQTERNRVAVFMIDGNMHQVWPELPLAGWQNAYATLHLMTQIVGKVRFELTPWLNHSWSVTLYVTVRGLSTGPIPLAGRDISIDFDFLDHVLWINTSDGSFRQIMLRPVSAAD